jgi:hypothetical protein
MRSGKSQTALQPIEAWRLGKDAERSSFFVHCFEQAQVAAEIGRLTQLRLPLPLFPKQAVFNYVCRSFTLRFYSPGIFVASEVISEKSQTITVRRA